MEKCKRSSLCLLHAVSQELPLGHPSKRELERINEMCQVSKVTPVLDCPELDFGGLIDYFFCFRDRRSDWEEGADNPNCLEKCGILYFLCGILSSCTCVHVTSHRIVLWGHSLRYEPQSRLEMSHLCDKKKINKSIWAVAILNNKFLRPTWGAGGELIFFDATQLHWML